MMHLDENIVILFCFITFLYLAYKPVRKIILSALDAKINIIKKDLEDTQKLKDEAQQLLAQVEAEVQKFDSTRRTIVQQAQQVTDHLVSDKQRQLNASLARKRDAALKTIAQEAEKIGQEMKHEFMHVVLNITKEYLIETNNNGISNKDLILHLAQDNTQASSSPVQQD